MFNFKSEEMFNVGDKVKVVKNSERRKRHARIGEIGDVIGYKANDCVVKFEDESIVYVRYSDLELIN